MKSVRSLSFLLASALLAACTAGGSGDAPAAGAPVGATEPQRVVEMFSWWIAPGEAEPLQAIVDLNKKAHPSCRIFNAAAVDAKHAKDTLKSRLASGHPPDLYQSTASSFRQDLKSGLTSPASLDDIVARTGLQTALFPEVLNDITVDGHAYLMPVNVHRSNTLFFNKAIFTAHGLTAPKTLAELAATAKKLKDAGVTPFAMAYQPWILRMMFNEIVLGVMGPETFRAYFTGADASAAALQKLGEGAEVFRGLVADYATPDSGNADFGWTDAADLVHDGKAAMYMHGNWVTGYYLALGWAAGVDFDAVSSPAAPGFFGYELDVFTKPVGGPNTSSDADDFLATIASPEGQVAFARLKGSTPVRFDVPRSTLDSLAKSTLEDLETASIRMLIPTADPWDAAIAQFTKDGVTAALIKAFTDRPPVTR